MASQLCSPLRTYVQLPVKAEMIEQVRVPSIAEWRWGTLHSAVDALAGVSPTLSTHFGANLIKNAVPLQLPGAWGALHSTAWVSWLCLSR